MMTVDKHSTLYRIVGVCFTLLLAFYSSIAQTPPNWNWVQTISGPGLGRGLSTTTTATGDIYQTGSFTRTIQLGATTLTSAAEDMYLVKYNQQGVVQWARQSRVPNASGPWAQGICVTTDQTGNVYVTGTFVRSLTLGTVVLTTQTGVSNTFVVKYNSQGTVLWAIASNSNNINRTDGVSTVVTTSGDVFVAGFFSGSTTFGNYSAISQGANDLFLLKINAAGTVQWLESAGGIGMDYAATLALAPNNGVYVGGMISETANFGTLTATSQGGTDAYIAAYDAQGTTQWVRRYGGPGNDGTGAITVAPTGELCMVGFFENSATFGSSLLTSQGANDGYVMKCTAQGNPIWVSSIGGTGSDGVYGVTINTNGTLYVAGMFSTTATFGNQILSSAGGTDIFLARYASNGSLAWVTQCGGASSELLASVVSGPNGVLYLGGRFSGTAQFGPNSITSQGSNSGFVASLIDIMPTSNRPVMSLEQCTVYPNPATGKTLFAECAAFKTESVVTVVLDMTGKTVRRRVIELKDINNGRIVIDIESINPGKYLLQCISGNANVIRGFSIE